MTGNVNTLLTSMNRSFRQKIDEAAKILNNTTDQVNLTDNMYDTASKKKKKIRKCHFFQACVKCSLLSKTYCVQNKPQQI